MKYATKIPPVDEDFKTALLNRDWRQIKEASNLLTAILFSIPFMLINVALSFLIIYLLDQNLGNAILNLYSSGNWSVTIRLDYLVILYLTVLIHEVIHLVLIPGFLRSEKTLFGIKPWGGFVYTAEVISKRRYLLISVAPYAIISLLLPLILGICGMLNGFIVFLVLLNALASSVDIMNAFLFMVQVPGDAKIISNGFKTYFRKIAATE
jgi:hypothetical protein